SDDNLKIVENDDQIESTSESKSSSINDYFSTNDEKIWSSSLIVNFIVDLLNYVDSTIKSYFEQQQTVLKQFHSERSGAYSIQGRRHNMEDCFRIHNQIGLELGIEYYAVFDGHGGQNAAIHADKEIYDSIVRRIKNHVYHQDSEQMCSEKKLSSSLMIGEQQQSKSENTCDIQTNNNRFASLTMSEMKKILNEEIISVDKQLVETFQRRSDISGSTALIAIRLLQSNKLLVANVGDSRGILCDSKGATIPLSFDHKPYQLKEYRRILEAGGYISLKGVYRVNGILAISRALGDYPLKDNRLIIPDPDILTFDLNELKPKFMIMATDGFWDTFSNENAVQFVQQELSSSRYNNHSLNESSSSNDGSIALEIAKKLAKEAYNRESYDNITVIVVFFDDFVTTKSSSSSSQSTIKSSPMKNRKKSSPISSSSSTSPSNESKPAIQEESTSS
ncbi:Protein phosphatase 1L, partial [Dermatophagoides pteronyssinus]